MNTKQLISLASLATLYLTSLASSVNAEQFAFNRNIGKVYVKNANVDFSSNGVTLSVNIHTPSCPNQYHINGSVTVKYTGPRGQGRVSRTWTFSGSDEEGIDKTFSDYLPYRQNRGGVVSVSTNSNCIYHGVRHGGIRLPF